MSSLGMGRFSSLVMLFVVFLSTFGHHRWNTLIPGAGLIVGYLVLAGEFQGSKHGEVSPSATSLRTSFPAPEGRSSLSAGWPRAVAPLPGSLRT